MPNANAQQGKIQWAPGKNRILKYVLRLPTSFYSKLILITEKQLRNVFVVILTTL